MVNELDEANLLAATARAGAVVSSHQLKRWRRAGLMPRPRIEHPPGLRGSRAFYPGWAVAQLGAVARTHRSVHRLEALSIALWWDGHWIEPIALRNALIAPLERLSEKARAVRAGRDEPYDAADAILALMTADTPHSALVALLRKRLGSRADLMNWLWTLIALGLGAPAPWEQEDRSAPDPARGALELLAAGAGIQRAITDDPVGRGPWIPSDFDLPGFIERLRDAGGFEVEDLGRPIREATDAELARARDDALMFSGPLATIGRAIEGLVGEDVAGFGALAVLTPEDTFGRAGFIRNMLILRWLVGDEAFASIAALVNQIHARFAAIAELRAALPEHEGMLRLDFAHRLAELPAAEADRVRDDVARYLEVHPQTAHDLTADT
jgi:hypothetical protein